MAVLGEQEMKGVSVCTCVFVPRLVRVCARVCIVLSKCVVVCVLSCCW